MVRCWRDDAQPPRVSNDVRNRDAVQTLMRTGRLPPEDKPGQEASLRLLKDFDWGADSKAEPEA